MVYLEREHAVTFWHEAACSSVSCAGSELNVFSILMLKFQLLEDPM